MKRSLITFGLLTFINLTNVSPLKADIEIKLPHYTIVSPNRFLADDKTKVLNKSAERFEDLLGQAPPFGTIYLNKKLPPGYPLRLTVAPSMNTYRRNNGKRPGWHLDWFKARLPKGISAVHAMTHEVAHFQFLHYVYKNYPPMKGLRHDGYSTYLPDWLDEGIAVYHEDDRFRKLRLRYFKKGTPVPLETYLNLSHPSKRNYSGAQMYYAQTMVFMDYLVVAAGKPFIRFVVSRYSMDHSFEEILQSWDHHFSALQDAQKKAGANMVEVEKIKIGKKEVIKRLPTTLEKLQQDFNNHLKFRL